MAEATEIDTLLQIVSDAEEPLFPPETLVRIIAAVRGKLIRKWGLVTGDGGAPEIEITFADGAGEHWPHHRWPDRSLDGVVSLMPPNWWWTLGLCHLSGDSSIGPDYNGPAGAVLHTQFPAEKWDATLNEDLRPGDGIPRVCQASLINLLTMRKWQLETA